MDEPKAANAERRLIAVSNRVAFSHRGAGGGLAVALRDALLNQNGLWFGWSGKTCDAPDPLPKLSENDGICFAVMDLSSGDYNDYYNGFANSALWPLLHYRVDLAIFDRGFYEGYLRVNAQFATGLLSLLRPDDLIWVHDYHLIALGEELRRLGVGHRIGFFLHTPFPSGELLRALPMHGDIVKSLFAYDLVGFQTRADCRTFRDYVVEQAGGAVIDDEHLSAFGRMVRYGHFPIGIDVGEFTEFTASDQAIACADRLRRSLNGGAVVIGVDRLDYSKGLIERFAAFEQMLRTYPDTRGQVTLLQVAPPSRSDVSEYARLRDLLETATGRTNGRFGDFDWTPIRYLNRSFSRADLAGLYRASQIGLVTPFRDGMNLVAKEYIAVQDPTDPGVLVLSEFAGAAQQLESALIVNPHDRQGVADAIRRGLSMQREERIARWRHLMAVIKTEDLTYWWRSYLAALSDEPEGSDRDAARPEMLALEPSGGVVRLKGARNRA